MTLDEETQQIQDKIIGWLVEENYDLVPKKDPTGTNDIYLICVLPGDNPIKLFIGKPKSGRRIVTGIAFSLPQSDRVLYPTLPEETRKRFRQGISRDLTLMEILVGFDPPDITNNFNSVRMMDVIYYDGLTKDRFFRAINNVCRAYSILMLNFEFHIPSFNPSSGSNLV